MPRILPAGEHFGVLSHQWSGGGFAVFHARYRPNTKVPLHGNEPATLVLTASGHCTKRIGTRDLNLSRGSMLVLPPGLIHSDSFPTATTFVAAEIDSTVLDRLRELGTPLTESTLLAPDDARELGARIQRELTQPDATSPLILESILLNAVGYAARRSPPRPARRPTTWLLHARDLLHDRAHDALRLSEVADAVGVHASRLSREFRRFFGVVPGEYLRRLRINVAARQLTESDTSIAAIAAAAGFSDQAHFSRAFRRVTGQSPRDYRRVMRPAAGHRVARSRAR